QSGPLLVFVQRPMTAVGSGLRHHIDEAPGTAPEFGRRAVGHHLKLFDRVETNREWRPLPAALLAKKRIVIIRTVYRNVIIDTLLPVDRDLVAIGTLHDGHTR